MKILLAFLLAVIFSNVSAQSDWKSEKLKGKVKSVKTNWTYRYMADGKNFTEWSAENGDTKTFSPAGHIRSVQYFKKGTELSSTSKYSYVPANNTYEAKGYWPDGRVISSSAYKTDDKGNILEEEQIDSAGIMSRKYNYTYDIKNRILFREGHTADGKLTSKTSYTYDAAGNRTDKTEMPRYATSYQTYKYDGNGNIAVEERLGAAGLHSFRFERSYDDKNNMIRELKYIDSKPNPSVSTWRYEYDAHGNWLKQTEYTEENEPFSIYERTIVYY